MVTGLREPEVYLYLPVPAIKSKYLTRAFATSIVSPEKPQVTPCLTTKSSSVSSVGKRFRAFSRYSKVSPSQLLGAWQRRSQALKDVIPVLYVEGLSTRDFKRALAPLWGKSGLSRSSISRANRALKESFNNWRKRALSREDIIYLFLDGIYSSKSATVLTGSSA